MSKTDKMIIPTVEEIVSYGETIELPAMQCAKFFDHHEARGWMLGKVRMVSWKAALRTWKSNWKEWGGQATALPVRKNLEQQEFDRLQRQIDKMCSKKISYE